MIDVGSYSSCNNPLQVSFSSDVTDVIRTFTCAQQGDMSIELWVTDAVTGVSDFCIAQITVVADMTCTPTSNMFSVSGEIHTEQYKSIERVEVTISSNVPSTQTDAEGSYAFQQMPSTEPYEVSPSKDVDHGNGVNTLDLIHIQRHILGLQKIESPYQLIAADINNSQNVDATDLVELRKLILGIYEEFPDNESWRFIDATHVFKDRTNPWIDYGVESMQINNMTGDVTADFIGVKVGDVDGTSVGSLYDSATDFRSQRWPLEFVLQEQDIYPGQHVTLPVYSRNYENILGWQGAITFDKDLITIINIKPSSDVEEVIINTDRLDEGYFSFSYAGVDHTNLSEDKLIFNIEFISELAMSSREIFALATDYTESEAYRGNDEVVPLVLRSKKGEGKNALIKVVPNPWISSTRILTDIRKAGEVTFEFYDYKGVLIYQTEKYLDVGQQTLHLDGSMLPAEGVIFVKLISDNSVSELKMIKH